MVTMALYPLHKLGLCKGPDALTQITLANGLLRLRAYSQNHSLFTELRNYWYPNGTKVVPANIGDYLTEYALVVWFLGDGSSYADDGQLSFNTQGFTKAEQDMLRELLWSKYGLKTGLVKDKTYNRISLTVAASRKFRDMVMPILPPAGQYKLKYVK